MTALPTPGPGAWDGNTLRPANPDPSTSAVHSILTATGGYGFLGSKPSDTVAELTACYALIEAAPRLLAALRRAQDCISQDRQAVADCHMGSDNRLDEDGQHAVDQYDAVLAEVAEAIAAATLPRGVQA